MKKTKYITRKIIVKVPYTPGDTESMKAAAEYVEALKLAVLGDDTAVAMPIHPEGTLIEFNAQSKAHNNPCLAVPS